VGGRTTTSLSKSIERIEKGVRQKVSLCSVRACHSQDKSTRFIDGATPMATPIPAHAKWRGSDRDTQSVSMRVLTLLGEKHGVSNQSVLAPAGNRRGEATTSVHIEEACTPRQFRHAPAEHRNHSVKGTKRERAAGFKINAGIRDSPED